MPSLIPPLPPPPEGFPQFSKLPSELRRIIWNECLPARRVVEIDYPIRRAHAAAGSPDPLIRLSWCRLDITTTENGRWPLISRVCREAREVFLEARCADIPPWQHGLDHVACDWLRQPEGCWIRAAQDILHLNWHPSGDYGDGTLTEIPARPDPVPYLAKVANMYDAAEVSLSAPVVLPFGPNDDLAWSWEGQTNVLKSLARCGKKFLLCVQTVTIHATSAEASLVGDGLFGALGDAPIALVDPLEELNGIEKARCVWRTFSRSDFEAAAFFAQASTLQDRVRAWSDKVVRLWLWHQWHAETDRDSVPPMEDIFQPAPSEGDLASALGLGVRENPWVAKQLGHMPQFRPVIMFRLCPVDCHLEVQDPLEVDTARRRASRARGRLRGRQWWYPPRIQHAPPGYG